MPLSCDAPAKSSKRRKRGGCEYKEVYEYTTGNGTIPFPNDLSAWIYLIHNAQEYGKDRKCRNPIKIKRAGYTRHLLVHPMIYDEMYEIVEGIVIHEEECGCMDCFGQVMPRRAMRVFAKRAWDLLPFGQKAALLKDTKLPPEMLRAGPEVLDHIRCPFTLREIAVGETDY